MCRPVAQPHRGTPCPAGPAAPQFAAGKCATSVSDIFVALAATPEPFVMHSRLGKSGRCTLVRDYRPARGSHHCNVGIFVYDLQNLSEFLLQIALPDINDESGIVENVLVAQVLVLLRRGRRLGQQRRRRHQRRRGSRQRHDRMRRGVVEGRGGQQRGEEGRHGRSQVAEAAGRRRGGGGRGLRGLARRSRLRCRRRRCAAILLLLLFVCILALHAGVPSGLLGHTGRGPQKGERGVCAQMRRDRAAKGDGHQLLLARGAATLPLDRIPEWHRDGGPPLCSSALCVASRRVASQSQLARRRPNAAVAVALLLGGWISRRKEPSPNAPTDGMLSLFPPSSHPPHALCSDCMADAL